MVKLFLVSIILCFINMCATAPPSNVQNGIMCAEYIATGLNAVAESDDQEYDDETGGSDESEYQPDTDKISKLAGIVQCSIKQKFCYSVWKVDEIGNATIVRQGCWDSDDNLKACYNPHCVSDSPNSSKKNHRFCCCTGNMCNQNTTIYETLEEINRTHKLDIHPSPLAPIASIWNSPLVWVCIAVTTAMIISLAILLACHSSTKSVPELAPLAPSGPGYSSNLNNVDNLKLCAMIGQGKYGTVWKGMVNERPVAVKIFPGQYKQYFINEKNIYSLSLMDSPSLLEYYGCDTRHTMNDNIEYLLVLSLAPFGCLQDWLLENTCTFNIFTKMAKSVARGLSHLHTELKKDGLEKPCICHRDLNTRNILVKADLSCCIADFGFAMKMYGARYEWKGEITLAETKSINEVGTLRYMAPEVLEGAVNLRDCETALKQIDVYSLGLVLWELGTRCQDWYAAGDGPPSYKAPYEAEVGKNPSFEHMQILVSRHKARPQFPANWGGTSASSRLVKETCEDCWDHDAEARLTALCAEERILELSVLGPNAQCTTRSSPIAALNDNQSISRSPDSNAPTTAPGQLHYKNVTSTIIAPPNQITPMQNSFSETTTDSIVSMPGILKNQTINNFLPSDSNASNFCRNEDGTGLSVEDLIASSCESICVQPKGWYGVRALIQNNLFKIPLNGSTNVQQHPTEEHSNLTVSVNIDDCAAVLDANAFVRKHNIENQQRPNNLDLIPQTNINRLSTIAVASSSSSSASSTLSKCSLDDIDGYRKPPGDQTNRAFAIINDSPRIVVSKSATTVPQLCNLDAIDDIKLKRQRSLEMFREVFGAKGSIERLRDPSQRVKTPGDVPPSVRKIRASKTLSLYDDRMMDTSTRNTM